MKKIFFIIFSLMMICNFSFALEPYEELKIGSIARDSYSSCTIGDFTVTTIKTILKNYSSDMTNETYKNSFNSLIEEIENQGMKYVLFYSSSEPDVLSLIVNNPAINSEILLCNTGGYNQFIVYSPLGYDSENTANNKLGHFFMTTYCRTHFNLSSSNYNAMRIATNYATISSVDSIYDSNFKIPDLTLTKTYWDGESYIETPSSSGSGGGILPGELTDEELAEIVTRFVNSEALISNNSSSHKDYFITYDALTGYYRAYTYNSAMDLSISYGNYDEDGNFITNGTSEGEAWQIRPYCFDGNIFWRLTEWFASKYNTNVFRYYSISPDSGIEPRYIGLLEYSYCSNYVNYESVVYSTKQIRFLGEKIGDDGNTEITVTEDFIPKTTLINSETGEEIDIKLPEQAVSESFFGQIVSLFDNLVNRIAGMFEPDVTSVAYLKSAIEKKLPVIGEVKTIIDDILRIFSNEDPQPPSITIPLSQAESSIDYGSDCIALDLSWYERYKDTVDLVIIGFAYAFFAWRLYHRLPGIISGSDGINWSVLSGEKTSYSGSGNFVFKPGGGKK